MQRTISTLYSYIFRNKIQTALFYLLLITFAVLENIQPYFYKLFIDSASASTTTMLFMVLIQYITIRIAELIFETVARIQWDRIIFSAARDLRVDAVKKIHDLDFTYHINRSTGSLISAIKRGDGAAYTFADTINFDLSRITIGFIVMLGFLMTIKLEITLIMLGTFILNGVAAYFLIKFNISRRNVYNEKEDEVSGIITDNLINFDTVKIFAKEEWEHTRLKNATKPWWEALWKYANSFRIIELVTGSIGNIGIFATLTVASLQLAQKSITPGEFVLVVGYVVTFYPRLFQIIYRLRDVAKSYADLEKYISIFHETITVKDPKKPIKKPTTKGIIAFKEVSFTYPEGKAAVLDKFNLEIPAGQSIAFVGRSGMGKTTLVKLLMRFYDIQGGEICIDGTPIHKMTKSQLRSLIGVVPQEPILFNNTIAYNIGYGGDNPDMEEIKKAAQLSFLEDFIESLPKGYETNVGERGIKLSGGQKQRLAIARVMLKNPQIIVFDEATSHLDSESEKKIQEAFWNIAQNKTTIIIAHRLATVMKADKIVVLQDGKIAESGKHKELIIKENGLYKQFWDMQADTE